MIEDRRRDRQTDSRITGIAVHSGVKNGLNTAGQGLGTGFGILSAWVYDWTTACSSSVEQGLGTCRV